MSHWASFTFAVAWTLITLILALALFGLLCLLWPEHRHHDGEDESTAAMIARSDARLAEAERLSDPENTVRLTQE